MKFFLYINGEMSTQRLMSLITKFWFVALILMYLEIADSNAFSSTYSAKVASANVTQLLDSLLSNYDKRFRPGHGSGLPTAIAVNMNVRSMGPVSEKEESYAMQLYMRQVWYDPRLRFNQNTYARTEFSLNWMFVDRIWKPDTFFINGKNSYFHKITAPNTFIRLRYNGEITWSMRLTVRATCIMHLRKFPLDTQHCPLKMASYGYTAKEIMYRWDPNKLVEVSEDVSLAQYELFETTTHSENITVRRSEVYNCAVESESEPETFLIMKSELESEKTLTLTLGGGNALHYAYVAHEGITLAVCDMLLPTYHTHFSLPPTGCQFPSEDMISTIKVKFHMRRQMGYYLLQVYVPCILIVCCSWVAFWITKKDVPGRVGLGVTTVLSMTHLGFGGLSDGPPVSYPTALDYFVVLCFIFVFAAVLEFAFINFVERAVNKRRKKMEELRKQMVDRLMAAKEGTMTVTTKLEEEKSILKDTFREVLKVPLTVVPLADEEINTQDKPNSGNTMEGLKNLMKMSLTMVPGSSGAMKEAEEEKIASEPQIHPRDAREGYETILKVPLLVAPKTNEVIEKDEAINSVSKTISEEKGKPLTPFLKSKFKRMKSSEPKTEQTQSDTKVTKSSEMGSEPTPAIVVDVMDDEPPPPPPKPVTIWELLMEKRKLIISMTPSLVIPAEEDILDRFSIVDLYARRIFPSLFFLFTSIYWILFTYYIPDEFANDAGPPSDGFVITSRL